MSDEGVVPLTYLYTVRLCDHISNMPSKLTVLTLKLDFFVNLTPIVLKRSSLLSAT